MTGPGGAGKTRLALEVGRRIGEQEAWSVTFVDLAAVRDAGRILQSIAGALGIVAAQGQRVEEAIAACLLHKPALLILDNFEQLLAQTPPGLAFESGAEDAALVVHGLLQRCPTVRCLVTSRECLEIEGEREYPVRPLSTPSSPCTPERLMEFASVQLFVDRAKASRPDFQLTPRNSDAVSTLCARLDGLPLAIEMAAAWSSVLSPAQILERLSRRFDLLVSRRKGRLARHETLRAALEWSYQLLDLDLRRFFSSLSIFRDGWTAEAAEAVCADPAALEQLRFLRERSLVTIVADETGDEERLRFRLLETIREFADEHLSEQERDALRRRHLRWYGEWAEVLRPALPGANQAALLRTVATDQENIGAALVYSLEQPESACFGLQLISALNIFWCLRGNYAEIRSLLDKLLLHPNAQEPTIWRARALNLAGAIAGYQQDWSAAKAYYEGYLELSREHGHDLPGATALMCLGNVASETGDYALARAYFEEGLQAYRTAGHTIGVASAKGALGSLSMEQHDFEDAAAQLEQAVTILKQEQNLSGATHHLRHLGVAYAHLGKDKAARRALMESLEGYSSLKDNLGMALLFLDIAGAISGTRAAIRLLAAAERLYTITSAAPFQLDSAIARERAAQGATAFQDAWREGEALKVDEAVEAARAILSRPLSAPHSASGVLTPPRTGHA